MDELELLAKRAESQEASEQTEREGEFEPTPQVNQAAGADISNAEAAQNRAESILKICEGGIKLLVDSRIQFTDNNMSDGRQALGGVIEKYDIQGDGTGSIPFEEEVRAGFFMGAMAKMVLKTKRLLSDEDKKQANKQSEQSNGTERERTVTEPTHDVFSEVGLRENTDVAPPFNHS